MVRVLVYDTSRDAKVQEVCIWFTWDVLGGTPLIESILIDHHSIIHNSWNLEWSHSIILSYQKLCWIHKALKDLPAHPLMPTLATKNRT